MSHGVLEAADARKSQGRRTGKGAGARGALTAEPLRKHESLFPRSWHRPDWTCCGTPCPSTGDRKSTRLNSSHGSISYAVFCLKKKKKKITENTRTQNRT